MREHHRKETDRLASSAAGISPEDRGGAFFVGLTRQLRFLSSERHRGAIVATCRLVRTPIEWTEVVASWNAEVPASAALRVELQAVYPDHATRWYCLGVWMDRAEGEGRHSVAGQRDDDGAVDTDVLRITRPCSAIRARLTIEGASDDALWAIRFFGLSFRGQHLGDPFRMDGVSLPVPALDVPEVCQCDYPGGNVWCSPTSVTMMLQYWANVLERSDLQLTVPEAAESVMDPVYGGTGNWSFNVAWAGLYPGMLAYVTRLASVGELAQWVANGVPVAVSLLRRVLYDLDIPNDPGHLVVCVGFADDGSPILNDPYVEPGSGGTVRRMVDLDRFVEAWAASHNTVYLIYPEEMDPPLDRCSHWDRTRLR